ncbi:MAG: winged helix-turn-helix transcriptional regulator [Proteobacteria bacterium]|nr:winged helix-turn-helix transcriptional regulator [Pseudomonadota bacterium]
MKQHFHERTLTALGSPSYLVRRLLHAFADHYEPLFAPVDITYPQWTILMLLYGDMARTSADMARQMSHDAGAMTRLVDQLEKRGLLRRRRDTADRRIVNLVLTADGRALADSLKSRVVDFLNVALVDFSNEELRTWVKLTTRMIGLIEARPVGLAGNPARKNALRTKAVRKKAAR